MSDVASLALGVDSSSVEIARQRLRDFRQAATDAGSGARDFTSSATSVTSKLAELNRAQQQTTDFLKSHTAQLGAATQQTNSYVDTLAKWATAAGGVYLVYQGMSGAVRMANDGMQQQVSILQRISDGLRSIAMYGRSSFQFMSDSAIAGQRALSMQGMQLGMTGAGVASFGQMTAPLMNPAQSMSALQHFRYVLNSSDAQAIQGRGVLTSLGIDLGGSPDDEFRQFVQLMQRAQPGQRRNQIADQILGPDAAKTLDDTITKLGQLTDLQLRVNSLNETNAETERQAAENRRQADIAWQNWASKIPVLSMFTGQQQANLGANTTLAENQLLGRTSAPWYSGVGTFFRGLGSYFTGGQPASAGNRWYQIGQPSYPPSSHALDGSQPLPQTPVDLSQGYGTLAAAGYSRPEQLLQMQQAMEKLTQDFRDGKIAVDDYNRAVSILGRNASDIVDPLAALSRQVQIAQAASAGAKGGSYAGSQAEIAAQVRLERPGATPDEINREIALRQQLSEAGITRSRNESMFSIWDQSTAMDSQTRAMMSGQGGAAAIFARARGRARREAPFLYSDDANTQLDTADPYVQSLIRQEGMGVQSNAADMVRRLTSQLGFQQSMLTSAQSGGSAGAMMSVRQQAGIDVVVKQLRDYADATDASNEKGAEAKKVYIEEADALDALSKKLEQIRPQIAAARLNTDVNAQVKELTDQTALLKSGASDDQLSYAKNLDALTKRSQLSGANLSPSDLATAAQRMTDAQKENSDALEQNRESAANASGAINTFSDDIGKLVLSGKNAHDVLLGIGRDFSQMGVKDFLVQPAEKMLKSLLMGDERPSGASGGGLLSFLTPNTSGGGLIAKWLGLGGGATGAAASTQTVATAQQSIANATITVASGTVLSPGGGSGGLGGLGGLNFTGASDMGGAYSYASLLGGSAATSGALAAGGADYASLLAAGAIAMHSGGIVGRDFSHISFVDPSIFRGARRYHMGGLASDEVPIIAQKGERILSRQEVANGTGGGTTVHVHGPLMHINSPDATGFRKTSGQAAGQMLDHINRLGRRNS